MNKLLAVVLSFLLLISTGCVKNLKINWITSPPEQLEQYGLFELSFGLGKNYQNPYDAEEVMVDLIVTFKDTAVYTVPCFYYEEYLLDSANLVLESTGKSYWKARYTPDAEGECKYLIRVKDANGIAQSEPKRLTVGHSENRGFIRNHNAGYLLFDDGSPLFLNGFNLSVPPRDRPLDYTHFFKTWHNNAMNYTRLWLAPPWGPYAFALEWTDGQYPTQKGKLGLKKYNQEVSARLDDFMRQAERYGIYIMLCLGDERELETGIFRGDSLPRTRSFWQANPYNAANGGPALSPLEFFIKDEAREIYKNRLRYLIARWGYSTHLMAWEFWNEIDHPKWCQDWNFVKQTIADWHREMGAYMKHTDPYHPIVSTSFSHENNQPLIWDLEVMDLVQGHNYGGSENMALRVSSITEELKKAFPEKPMFLSEYGTDFRGYTHKGEAEEIAIHNSIWASALSGGTGTTMWWWWNSIDGDNLYFHYRILGQFIKDIPWTETIDLAIQSNSPLVFTVGRGTGDEAWIWVHNTGNNWDHAKNGIPVGEIDKVSIRMPDFRDGRYLIAPFDTYEGNYLPVKQVEANGYLEVRLPELKSDLAFKIKNITND